MIREIVRTILLLKEEWKQEYEAEKKARGIGEDNATHHSSSHSDTGRYRDGSDAADNGSTAL
jgi:hypothetical protein